MSKDVRIDPVVSTTTVAGVPVTELALFLGGVPRGAVAIVAPPNSLDDIDLAETMNQLAYHGYESVLAQPEEASSGVLNDDAIVSHLVQWLNARGWTHEQIGVIGYGYGAHSVLVAGSQTAFGAVISIPSEPHSLLVSNRPPALRSPWLGLIGLGERGGLTEELASYFAEVEAASIEHTSLVGYQGVAHCLRDSTDALVHTVAFDSWQRTVEWLNIHVAPRPTPLARGWQKRQESLASSLN